MTGNTPIRHLYIECTHTAGSDLNTGIQRVVRKVIKQLGEQLDNDTAITLVAIRDGQFYALDGMPDLTQKTEPLVEASSNAKQETNSATSEQTVAVQPTLKSKVLSSLRRSREAITSKIRWKPLHHFLTAPRTEFGLSGILYMVSLLGVYRGYKARKALAQEQAARIEQERKDSPIKFTKGDVILMLDSSWHLPAWEAISQAKTDGAKVIAVIYDLIPITHSQFCDEHLCNVFSTWFEQGKSKIDGYIAISKTVRQNLQDYLSSMNSPIADERLGYFYLGADIAKQEDRARDELRSSVSKQHSYLIVSTIEPRKNHQYLFDSFNQLWQKDVKATLHIVGRVGWKTDALINAIKQHPQYNKQLFLWNDLDDAELVYCYKNSKALVFPSYVEGFGLPIIEAQHYKLPVLVSDTPIHREVGKDSVIYFDITNNTDLASKITEIEAGTLALKDGQSFKLEEFTWENSAQQLKQEIIRINTVL